MQTQNKLIDDLARVASSALGVATGLRHEAEGQLRRQFERILADMDLVTREEYEVTRVLAETARAEQEALAERVAELEKRLTALSGGAAAEPARAKSAGKTAASKTAATKGRTRKAAAKPRAKTAGEPGAEAAGPVKTGATGGETPGSGGA
jgi:BMFP domain-containing protein YqiC